jgi:hypothetical protein
MKVLNQNKKMRIGAIALLTSASLIGLMSWMAPAYYQPTVENDLIRWMKKRSAEANLKLPEDRVYLQFDKPFYNPGDLVLCSGA